MTATRFCVGIAALAAAMSAVTGVEAQEQQQEAQAAPRAECGPGSQPETDLQGRVTAADYELGHDFSCNVEVLGHIGAAGGFKVFRYVDEQDQECAFYDSTLLFPTDVFDNLNAGQEPGGVFVLDMSDPKNPTHVTALVTPAMLSPHESLVLNEKRGLLAAVMGNPTTYPGIIDLYDVTQDCLHPTLLSSTPIGLLGHESGFAPDGNTLYVSSLITGNVTAVDVTNPLLPVPFWTGEYSSHGVSVSDDGNRVYFSSLHVDGSAFTNLGLDPGLVILDATDIQNRVIPPQPTVVSKFRWEPRSTPQIAIPVTFGGVPHLIEVDEFAGVGIPDASSLPGAARIIDISDDKEPAQISDIRLEVHQAANRGPERAGGDPGANSSIGGYAGHYCSVPTSTDPDILACSFILSGLRVFDITDPEAPREIAYFNPIQGGQAFSMSAPAFVPERSEIWFTDGNKGFYAVRLTNDVWGDTTEGSTESAPEASPAAPQESATETASSQPGLPSTGAGRGSGGSGLPLAATGGSIAVGLAALAAAAGLVLRRS